MGFTLDPIATQFNRGAKLYTNTIKEAIEKADKAPVKGGKK